MSRLIIKSILITLSLSQQIILSRRAEVLELECEMSAVHGLLSTLPRDLKYEEIIAQALRLFEKHPPKSLVRKHHKLQERYMCVLKTLWVEDSLSIEDAINL